MHRSCTVLVLQLYMYMHMWTKPRTIIDHVEPKQKTHMALLDQQNSHGKWPESVAKKAKAAKVSTTVS